MLSTYIVDTDYQDIVNKYQKWKVFGQYSPESPLTVFLNEELSLNPELQRVTFLHEFTHLTLTTSTSIGHFTQLLTSIKIIDEESPSKINSSLISQILNTLYDISWNIQEGAATLYPFLYDQNFTQKLVLEKNYSNLPARYKYATSLFAKAIGALLPFDLVNFGYIFVNAVAQFCLNTDIIGFYDNYLSSLVDKKNNPILTLNILDHLSDGKNNPNCRLLKLVNRLYQDINNEIPTRIRNVFIERISNYPFVKVLNNQIAMDKLDMKNLLKIQDTLNNVILIELDQLFPNTLSHFHSNDVYEDIKKILNKLNLDASNWNAFGNDIEKRAAFLPSIFYFKE